MALGFNENDIELAAQDRWAGFNGGTGGPGRRDVMGNTFSDGKALK